MVDLHQALGLRYAKLGSTAKSLQHYEKAKQLLYDHTGDHKDLQSVCNNAGNTYQRNKVGVIKYLSHQALQLIYMHFHNHYIPLFLSRPTCCRLIKIFVILLLSP